MRSMIGWAVPCGPRFMKYGVEEKVIDVACDECTITTECPAEEQYYIVKSAKNQYISLLNSPV